MIKVMLILHHTGNGRLSQARCIVGYCIAQSQYSSEHVGKCSVCGISCTQIICILKNVKLESFLTVLSSL